jgi:hypothetical protein
MVTHTCNPSTQKAEAGGSQVQATPGYIVSSRPAWYTMCLPPNKTKQWEVIRRGTFTRRGICISKTSTQLRGLGIITLEALLNHLILEYMTAADKRAQRVGDSTCSLLTFPGRKVAQHHKRKDYASSTVAPQSVCVYQQCTALRQRPLNENRTLEDGSIEKTGHKKLYFGGWWNGSGSRAPAWQTKQNKNSTLNGRQRQEDHKSRGEVSKMLSQIQTNKKRAGGVAQVVEHLPRSMRPWF